MPHPPPRDIEPMSAIASDELARSWARRIERNEARRLGLPIAAARKRVAYRLGVAPGTLENLSRDRMKGVRLWLFDTLKAAVVADLRREIAAHEHELAALARDSRGDLGGSLAEAEAGLVRLRALISEASPN